MMKHTVEQNYLVFFQGEPADFIEVYSWDLAFHIICAEKSITTLKKRLHFVKICPTIRPIPV
jgi:hypothetical protein